MKQKSRWTHPPVKWKMEKETTQFLPPEISLKKLPKLVFPHLTYLLISFSAGWPSLLGAPTFLVTQRLLLEQRELFSPDLLSPLTWNLHSLPLLSVSELYKGNKGLVLILCKVPSGPVPQYIPSPIYQLKSSISQMSLRRDSNGLCSRTLQSTAGMWSTESFWPHGL